MRFPTLGEGVIAQKIIKEEKVRLLLMDKIKEIGGLPKDHNEIFYTCIDHGSNAIMHLLTLNIVMTGDKQVGTIPTISHHVDTVAE